MEDEKNKKKRSKKKKNKQNKAADEVAGGGGEAASENQNPATNGKDDHGQISKSKDVGNEAKDSDVYLARNGGNGKDSVSTDILVKLIFIFCEMIMFLSSYHLLLRLNLTNFTLVV